MTPESWRPLRALTRRLLVALLVAAGVLTAVFLVLEAIPGDAITIAEDPRVPAAQRERLRAIYGHDDPLLERWARWMGAAVRGDFGASLSRQQPVTHVLGAALGPTALLATTALLLELSAGLLLGLLAAWRVGSWLDRSITTVAVVLYSLPALWLGLVALLVFAVHWPIFPAGQMRSTFGSPDAAAVGPWLDGLRHLALPALVLAATGVGAVSRFVRDAVAEALGSDAVAAARARGIPERRVLVHHALRPNAGALAQWTGLELARLLSGAVAIEVVFAWPGLGRVAYEAVWARDTPLILGTTALGALLVVAGGLLADALQVALDPRLRRGASRDTIAARLPRHA